MREHLGNSELQILNGMLEWNGWMHGWNFRVFEWLCLNIWVRWYTTSLYVHRTSHVHRCSLYTYIVRTSIYIVVRQRTKVIFVFVVRNEHEYGRAFYSVLFSLSFHQTNAGQLSDSTVLLTPDHSVKNLLKHKSPSSVSDIELQKCPEVLWHFSGIF